MRRYRAIAQYYDDEYADKPLLREDVPFLLQHLPKKRQNVLELCVGTARAAIPLAQAGHRVVGVDYADDMLGIAKRKRDAVGLTDRQLKLVRQDVTNLKLGEKFDWAVLLFNTLLAFTTLEEQDALLAGVTKHLKKGGRFWIDIFQPNLQLLATPSARGVDGHQFYVHELDRTVFQTTDIDRDPAEQVQKVTFRYQWFDREGRPHKEKRSFDLTFMFPRELRLLIERHGMRIEKLYGNYDGSELNADSPRMIALCRVR
jgi:ubiquinone/menaquinone biosynthesis C-methylase UbiE